MLYIELNRYTGLSVQEEEQQAYVFLSMGHALLLLQWLLPTVPPYSVPDCPVLRPTHVPQRKRGPGLLIESHWPE
ncbi:hypothetical protein TNCV_5069591 [Trichonephila clavipes]|nr:hypothetical protein TNCV_5069591 [Trichonephila clavipes]